MTHEDYRELLAAHALTALDAADARALDAHLESCAECRAELSEWLEVSALIALDAEPVAPSAQLRDRILANVAAEARANGGVEKLAHETRDETRLAQETQEFRSTPNVVTGESRESATESPTASAAESKVLPFERPETRSRSSFGSFGAIAAMLVIAALIISLLVLWQQNRATQRELARVSAEMNQAKAERDHERAVLALITSPDARMATLAGTPVAPGARAMLAYDKTGHAMLMTKGLPAAPPGMAYQLWSIKDGKKMPGKVFITDAAGNGMLEDQIPAVAREAAVFAVTLEPAGGVQSPTGSIYLVSAS
jgi:anti-sigma-K factor RskA